MKSRIVVLGLAAITALSIGCGDDESGAGGAGGASSAASSSSSPAGSTTTAATSVTSSASHGASSSATSTSATGSSTAAGGGVTCGDEPYVDVHLTVRSYLTDGLVEGAELTVDLCPGLSILTQDDGELDAAVERQAPFQARIAAENHLTMRLGEQSLDEAFEADVPIFPTLAAAILPDWGEDRPSLMVLVDVHADELEEGDPCASAEGFAVSVVGHPEAVVTYYAGDSTPIADPELDATGPLGLAAFEGLDATGGAASIELTIDKDGCDQASFVSYPFTGRHSLEDGVLTVSVARVPPLAAP